MKKFADFHLSASAKVSDKWDLYLREYERLFSPYRKKSVSIFEIGVQNGGSLEILSKYFPKAKAIIGCDINPHCAKLEFEDSRISVIIGDAAAPDTRLKLLEKSSNFDIIIDDGSHTSSDIVKAFAAYFPLLNPGGLFVIEDLHCSYWQEYEGGIFFPYSSISFLKHFVDIINYDHWGVKKKRSELIEGFELSYGIKIDDALLAELASVEFVDSICVIKKRHGKDSGLGLRQVSGEDASVYSDICHNELTESAAPTQFKNSWSMNQRPPAEMYVSLVSQLNSALDLNIQLQKEKEEKEAERTDELDAIRDLNAQLQGEWESKEAEFTNELVAIRDLNARLQGEWESKEAEFTNELVAIRDLNAQLQGEWESKEAEFTNELVAIRDLNTQSQREKDAKDAELVLISVNLQIKETEVNRLNDDLQSLRCEADDLRANLKLSQAEVKLLHYTISELYGSSSWRYTALFRHLKANILLCSRLPRILYQKLKHAVIHRSGQDLRVATVSETNQISVKSNDLQGNCSEFQLFDSDFYLKAYPDLAKAGVDPWKHFLKHGKAEGRLGHPPNIDLERELNEDLQTLLVVSHEASLTGAPILSLNIVQHLSSRYNVVTLLLGVGPLLKAFKEASSVVVEAKGVKEHSTLMDAFIYSLTSRFDFKFAIVNSVECRLVLLPLFRYGVPSITLVHEFASYTRPMTVFSDALYWTSEVVFSTKMTLENASNSMLGFERRNLHVSPQGRCLVPQNLLSVEALKQEKNFIMHKLRPVADAKGAFVVLGAGTVQFRKGVDIFIQCAIQVIEEIGPERVRFVWIGDGFDPEKDLSYSVYLEDQMERSGVRDSISFLKASIAIDSAFEESDLLLLCSRLDPLPNVAIDAMHHGVPVICFENASGIAPLIQDIGLSADCVAPYLDTGDMVKKIINLINRPSIRKEIGSKLKSFAADRFNMESYISSLEGIAALAAERFRKERGDSEVILSSGCLRKDFCAPPNLQWLEIKDYIQVYVRGWATGITCRKPVPGFHPSIYREHHADSCLNADPYAHYLRNGSPEGVWKHDVVRPSEKHSFVPLAHSLRVAIHIHVFYSELFDDFLKRLKLNTFRHDLWISVPDQETEACIKEKLAHYEYGEVNVETVPNRGRDIGPFLTQFKSQLQSRYDVIGHLHTKKSELLSTDILGSDWYHFLLENLIGGDGGAMADNILNFMASDESIGLVFPEDPNVIGWSLNRHFALSLAEKMGLNVLPNELNFPVGTMFWARAKALEPLFALNLEWDDYPQEPIGYDGTMLHAIERLIPLVVEKAGYKYAVTNVPGVSR